jgi:modulator of FtsH protease HflC
MTVQKATLQKLAVVAFFGFVGLIVLSSSAYTVDQTEQAVIIQFGEPIGDIITEPGLHWKKPFVQEVRFYDKRINAWDGDVNQIPTLGREFIIVDTMARWRIVEPLIFLESVRDVIGAQGRLDDILDSVVRDKISGSELEEIVRSKSWVYKPEKSMESSVLRQDIDLTREIKKGREQLTREVLENARGIVSEYGIELIDVRIKRLNYIADVRRSVEQRMISERGRIAEQFRSEGQGKSAEIDGKTSKQVRKLLSDAQRLAEEIKGDADAEATRIYGESYGQDPEFYAFFKTLESYQQAVGPNSTLMLDANSDFFKYLQKVMPEGIEFSSKSIPPRMPKAEPSPPDNETTTP